MARFEITGLDEVIRDMKKLGETSGEAAKAMLMVGAEEVRKGWKQSAEEHGHRDSGDMIASIGYARKPSAIGDALSIDIYPQGRDRKGVSNAEKAFILHYGKNKRPGSRWVDHANERSEPAAGAAMTRIWDRYIATGEVQPVAAADWHTRR